MKTSRLLSVIACTLGLSGCFLPSGVNPTLGCSPILGCTERDYYLPGKGVWAPKPVTFGKKAQIGAVVGTALGTYVGRGQDPLTIAALAVGGGVDPMAAIAQKMAAYVNNQKQKDLYSCLTGAFGSINANSSSSAFFDLTIDSRITLLYSTSLSQVLL